MRISIDPGQKLGVCVWLAGWPTMLHTLSSKKKSYAACRAAIWQKLSDFMEGREQHMGDIITEIAIEKPEQGHLNVRAARQHENLRGYLIHGLERWRDGTPVFEISKGRAPKSEAEMLARSFNLEGDEHAMDALHIGCLAGWLDKRKKG